MELGIVLNNACFAALNRGDWETARELSREQLLVAREIGDPTFLYFATFRAAQLALADNDLQRALELHEEALSWARQSGSAGMVATAWSALGWMKRQVGDLDGAASSLHEAQRLEAELGDKRDYPGATEQELAAVALDRGDIQTAVVHLLEYNDAVERIKEDSQAWTDEFKPLSEWARVAIASDEYELAVTLLGAEETFRDSSPILVGPLQRYRADIQQSLVAARKHLDPDRYDGAWNRGLQMTSTEALDYAIDSLATGSA
jgi:tetratricopeptide (TPR) repeat protein